MAKGKHKEKEQLTIPGVEPPKKEEPPPHMIVKINSYAAKLTFPFIGINDTRHYMRGINIRPLGETGVAIVACNGSSMLVVLDSEGFAENEIIVSLPKEATAHMSPHVALNVMSDGKASLLDSQLEPVYIAPGNSIVEGDFPRFENLIFTRGYQEGISGAINPSYLKEALKIDANRGYIRFWTRPNDAESPLLFKIKNVAGLEVVGIVHKVKDTYDLLPDWFPEPSEYELTKGPDYG